MSGTITFAIPFAAWHDERHMCAHMQSQGNFVLRKTRTSLARGEATQEPMAKDELTDTYARVEEEHLLFPCPKGGGDRGSSAVAEEPSDADIAREPLVVAVVKEENLEDPYHTNPYIVKALTCVKNKSSPAEPQSTPTTNVAMQAKPQTMPTGEVAMQACEIVAKKARPQMPPVGESRWRAPLVAKKARPHGPPVGESGWRAPPPPIKPPPPRPPFQPPKPPTPPRKRPAECESEQPSSESNAMQSSLGKLDSAIAAMESLTKTWRKG